MKKQTTKKASKKKTTPKVSPVKGKTVQWYIENLDGWQATVVKELDELISKAAPKATSSIKWAQPVYEHEGPFCFIRSAKKHVTIGFWRGTELHDPDEMLEGSGKKMQHVKIMDEHSIPKSGLRKLLKQAVKLNQAQGDPTR